MHDEAFLIGLLVAVAVLGSLALARWLEVPYAVFLVVAGVGVSFIPGVPAVKLSPDVIFYVFLPPLLYYAGFLTSPRELRANAVPIGLLAFGLVVATTVAVALVAHAVVPGLGFALAFVLGAVVAPTDPVAATSVIGRLGGPKRIATILEGESLVNDGIALTIYGLALTAVSAHVSAGYGLLRFIEVALGGVVIGIAVGWVVSQVRQRVHDTGIDITVSLVTPYVAYIPADRLGLSGVLATVTVGIFLGSRSTGLFKPQDRVQAQAFWEVLDFLLNSVLFVLLGLQFRGVVTGIEGVPLTAVVVSAAAVSGAVVVVRLVWQLVLPPTLWRVTGCAVPAPGMPWRHRFVIGWSGLRGAISLAAAFAIPLNIGSGEAFPLRNLVLFLTFVVIVVTLVAQGTTLPYLVRRLGLTGAPDRRSEEAAARRCTVLAALGRLDELASEDWVPNENVEALRSLYQSRLARLTTILDEDADDAGVRADRASYQRVRSELISVQRQELYRVHRQGRLSLEEMRRIERELDLEETSLSR